MKNDKEALAFPCNVPFTVEDFTTKKVIEI